MGFFSFDSQGLSRQLGPRDRSMQPSRNARARRRRGQGGTGENLERLEARHLLAFDLVAAYAQSTTPFYVAGTTAGTVTLDQAPQQITLRFSPGMTIDSNTLGSISVTRSGKAGDGFGVAGSVPDVVVVPGSIAVDDLPNKNQVIIRFAETLPDDSYRINITSGLTAGSGTSSFSQASQDVDLRLDLGAQVVSVVPQPVLRQKTITVNAIPSDGDLLTVTVRGGTRTFEFDSNSAVTAGNTAVSTVGKTAAQLAADLVGLLNAEATSGRFQNELKTVNAPTGAVIAIDGVSFTPKVSFTRGGSVPASSPVAIADGGLTQLKDRVVVYFNANDPLDPASAQTAAFYQLFDTSTTNGSDLSVATPTTVSYDATSGTAVLSFAAGVVADGKTFRLRVGVSEDSNNTVGKAIDIGSLFTTNPFAATAFLGEASLNDVDLYKVALAAAGTLNVDITPDAALSPLIRLFDSTGVEIASDPSTVNQLLTAGTYYVGISSTGNAAYATDGTGAAGGTTAGSYTLVMTSDVTVPGGDENSSFASATALGTLGAGGATVNAVINVRSTVATPAGSLQFGTPPGALDQPGIRSTPADSGSHGCATTTVADASATPVMYYNFKAAYGSDPYGNALTNLITEDQKQRAREVFEIYSRYTGMRFIESSGQGLTIVTGDMRALSPSIPPNGPIGLAGGGMAIMSSLVNWGSSDEYGGSWFETAMHEIGHLLGLAHSYDLPSIMGGGLTGEKVYPGDYDELQLMQYYQTTGSDIDVYSFTLPTAGTVTAATVIARPGQPITSTLDSVITVYRQDPVTGAREMVARNDDSFGRDSFLSLDLAAGTYFVAVTSAGNTNFNPEVENSGGNGKSDGAYQLKLGFTPEVRTDTTIVDATQTPLDGDRDGTPGGAFDFWFNTAADASTVFVDKAATAVTTTGTYAKGVSTVTVASAAALAAGMKVTGAGIPAGTLVGSVNSGTKQITLVDASSNPVATSLAGTNTSLTFGGTAAAPFKTLSAAVAAAAPGSIVRVVGNTGNVANPLDDQPYLIGKNAAGATLADGLRVNVPQGVTLVIDESALFKMGASVVDVGSSQPNVSRAGAAIQVLGTPLARVVFTSFHDDTVGLDGDGVGPAPSGGDWGGIVLRADSDSSSKQIFVNTVANADLRYGGGSVLIDSQLQSITPLHLVSTRPTLAFNTITDSSGAGISADPNSFEDTSDVNGRAGPEFRGNLFTEARADGAHQNSINGVFVRINTSLASSVDKLTVPARFKSRDVVYVITENLLIAGGAGGYENVGGVDQARATGRLQIDPGVVVKLQGSRIELERGTSQLIAEGLPGQPVVFTSFGDNRYGAGGTFDTNGILPDSRTAGDWGGIFLNVGAKASIDNAYIGFGGGQTPIEGGYSTFDVIEVHQGDLRLANSRIENNAATTATSDRTGRGTNTPATIFVRGAQPIIVGNDFRDNAGATVSINANALIEKVVADPGRSTGTISRFTDYDANYGPLVRDNRLTYASGLGATVGMVVRAEEITTETVWDDTDIVHVLTSEITVQNFNGATGIRLQSDTNASLVVKLAGANAGITAAGYALEIDDRIGGTVHVVGAPGYPVVMTSVSDDTVGASLDASGIPVTDTNGDGASVGSAGQWRGLKFLPLSNDRNVEILNESELAVTTGPDVNGTVGTAQVLGTLGPNYADPSGLNTTFLSAQEKGGDDNRRLGFQVQGAINFANAHDVDVYSFTGYAGSEVWFDIDKSSPSLDTMIELLDADGNVLARSTDSQQTSSATNKTVYGADDPGGDPLFKLFQLPTGIMGTSLSGTIYIGGGATETFTYDPAGGLSFANALGVPAIQIDQANSWFDTSTGELWLAFLSAPGSNTTHIVVSYSSSPLDAATLGAALPLMKDQLKGGDGYSVNPRDAGMRVVLPGSTGQVIQYYVRVRSQPKQDSAGLEAAYGLGSDAANYEASLESTTFDQPGDAAAGATSGRYELRIRLRQADEKPGSTVRYADIRFPTVGIDVLGLPRNSALLGETGESTADNSQSTGAQELGNLLTTDRNTISVAGALTSAADVDWFTFELNYEQIQAIGGVNSGGKTWSTVFDIDYGDGFRGDYTLSVFDRNLNLIYVGRDSSIPDDALLAGASQGAAAADLSRGSFGALDPFIGPVQMNAGIPTQSGRQTNDGSSAIPASTSTYRYYVAVSSNDYLPAALDATFKLTSTATATNTLVRMEPVNSTTRVVEDHIGFTGYTGAGGKVAPTTGAIIDTTTSSITISGASITNLSPVVYIPTAAGSTAGLKPGMYVTGTNMPTPVVIRSIDGPQLLTLSAAATGTSAAANLKFYDSALDASVRAFTLADVTLFVATSGALYTYDAKTGAYETLINNTSYTNLPIGDLDMRPDGRLYAYAGMTNNTSNVGELMELDTGNGTIVASTTDSIANKASSGATNYQTSSDTVLATAFGRTNTGTYGDLYLIVKSGAASKFYKASTGGSAASGGASATANQAYNDANSLGYRGNIQVNGVDVQVTGLQFIEDTSGGFLYGVTDTGLLIKFATSGGGKAGSDTAPEYNFNATVVADYSGDLAAIGGGTTGFTGLTAAPQNLYDGLFRGKFFAVTNTNRLVLLDPATNQASAMYGAGSAAGGTTDITGLSTAAGGTAGLSAGMLAFGNGIAVGTTLASVAGTTATLSQNIAGAQTYGAAVASQLYFVKPASSFSTTLASSTTVTATAAQLGPVTEGMVVIGTGIPSNTLVAGRQDATHITLTNAATVSTAQTLSFLKVDVSRTGATTQGSPSVTLSKTSDLRVGMLVFGTGFQDNTRISAINRGTNTITLSKNPGVGGTSAANVLSFVNTSTVGYVSDWAQDANSSPAMIGGITGIAFSPLDINLWHPTETRGSESGHGITTPFDNTRTPGTNNQVLDVFGSGSTYTEAAGVASMYFGLEDYNTNPRNNHVYYVDQSDNGQFGVLANASYNWQQELTANPSWGNSTYAAPGGSYGSLITKPFSLAGYTYADKPTLYFNYWLDTPDLSGGQNSYSMRDAARVFYSVDGGSTWTLAATNNQTRSTTDSTDAELPTFVSASSRMSSNANQNVQQLFDSASWRQARIDLGDAAGASSIQLRFDFTTSGDYDRAQTDADGNLVNGFNAPFSTNYGYFTSAERGQSNASGGFFVDDIVVGFAERGEMVTGTAGTAAEAAFFNIGTPTSKNVPPQSLYGPYQLTIRRGTEYGTQGDPSSAAVSVFPFDTNTRFIPEATSPPLTLAGDGLESGYSTVTYSKSGVTAKAKLASQIQLAVSLQNSGDTVTLASHGFANGTPVIFSLDTTGDIVVGDTYYVVAATANTFQLANTLNGPAVGLSADGLGLLQAIPAVYYDTTGASLLKISPAADNDFAVLAGVADTDRARAVWTATLADTVTNTLRTSGYLQFAYINTVGKNSLPDTFVASTAAADPAGQGVAVSVDNGVTWYTLNDIGAASFWTSTGFDVVAAMAARGLAASTLITNGSTSITVPSTSGLAVGMTVTGSGIQAGTTVVSIDSKVGLTLSKAAIATTAAVSLTFTPVTGTAVTLPGTVQVGFFQSRSGTVAIDDVKLYPSIPTLVTGTIGDRNPVREQGQFLITNNIVRNASTYGISIDAGVRDATGIPHPGVPANLRYLSNGRLAPGAVIANNIVAESGTAAIRFSGDSAATPASAVPYGRIVNNTIFGGATFQTGVGTTKNSTLASVSPSFIPYLLTGMTVTGTGITAGTTITAINAAANTITLSTAATATGSPTGTFTSANVNAIGVAVTDNAAPTLLNNVFARLATGISVDATSRVDSSGNLRTVMGANAYYQVTTQIGGTPSLTQNDAVTVTADPFVKSYASNFYPAKAVAGSPSIIDSSLNTLQDRNEYVNLISPLGMPPSPIIAPSLDIYGQLRADDPTVASSPGLGANPFKDRGAIDRVDTVQPIATLATPLDGSTSDKASSSNFVRLEATDAGGVTQFVLQLSETGIGIDKSTPVSTAFTLKHSPVAITNPADWSDPLKVTTLTSTSTNGYVFRYLSNTNQVILESSSAFALGQYLIQVDNTSASAVADLAGNKLLNNDIYADPTFTNTTAFSITLVDVPGKPTGVAGVSIDDQKVTIGWTAPSSTGGDQLVSYIIQRSLDGLTGWTTVPAGQITITQATPTTTQATISGLTNGTGYYFRIAATNSLPASVSSPNWSSVSGPIAPLAKPGVALNADTGSSTSDGITKDAVVNVTLQAGAGWQWSSDNGTTWNAGTGTSFTLPAGSYAATAVQVQQKLPLAGNFWSQAGSLASPPASYTVDTTVVAPAVALGTGVGLAPSGGATAAEAKQASGIVVVQGELNASIIVTLVGTAHTVTKTVTGAGTGIDVAVTLVDADLSGALGLGEGLVTVTAVQTDVAGNVSVASSPATFTLDTVAPTVAVASDKSSLKAGQTATITFTLGEASSDFVVGDVTVTGGTLSGFAGSGTSYTATFTPDAMSIVPGAISVAAATFTDAAGNDNTAGSLSPSITVNTVVPTVSIASSAASLKAGQTATITFTLSEASTNFTSADVSVAGGSLSGFAGSGTSYTATFTPTAGSATAGTISVAAGTFTDAAGNDNTAGSLSPSIAIDTVVPTIGIASSASSLKAGQTATITFTLSEASTNFTQADVSAAGGLLSSWNAVSGTVYTATFTPTASSTVTGTISVAAGTFTDAAGNDNTAGSLSPSISIDTVVPTIAIASSTSALKAGQTATITFTLSESSTNFTQADVSAAGGLLSSWNAVSGTVYTATFTPTASFAGTGTISVAAATFTDAAGNDNTAGSLSPSIAIDTVVPTIAIASSASALKAGQTATITFTLSEASTNFTQADVSAAGGLLSSWNAVSGTVYTATFTPTASFTGTGTISVAAATFTDAAGNNNTAGSLSPSITIDTVVPTIGIASSVSSLKAGQTATITFTLSEVSTNFTQSDVSVTGGSLSGFAGSGTSYTATFTPTASSTATGTISVAAATFTDAAGNDNTAGALSPSITINTIAPTVSIASTAAALKAGQTATITFTLSEASTNFTAGDVAVTGGTLSGFAGSGTVYTATFTPTPNATVSGTVTVAVGAFTNAVGNANTAAGSLSPQIAIDTLLPFVAAIGSTTPSGTYGVGATIDLRATVSETIKAGGAIRAVLNTGAKVTLTAATDGTTLTGTYTSAAGESTARLAVVSFEMIPATPVIDLAGNQLTSTSAPNPATVNTIVIDASIKATVAATGFSTDPNNVADKKAVVLSIPITFNTAVKGLTLSSFRLFLNGKAVSLTGATVTGSGTSWTLKLPSGRTSLKGIYNLQILPTGIKAVANNAAMTTTTNLYWGYGASRTVRSLAFAGL